MKSASILILSLIVWEWFTDYFNTFCLRATTSLNIKNPRAFIFHNKEKQIVSQKGMLKSQYLNG